MPDPGPSFELTMSFSWKLLDWFAKDPIRILTVIGGAGGVVYWWDRFRNRSRLRVRLLSETSATGSPAILRFEAQNLGSGPMSLEPVVVLTGYTPMKREPRLYYFAIAQTTDRSLPPHSPRTFDATSPTDDEGAMGFLWYRQYTFSATRGRTRRVLTRYVDGPLIPAWRFRIERLLFRVRVTQFFLVNRVGPKGPMRLQ